MKETNKNKYLLEIHVVIIDLSLYTAGQQKMMEQISCTAVCFSGAHNGAVTRLKVSQFIISHNMPGLQFYPVLIALVASGKLYLHSKVME